MNVKDGPSDAMNDIVSSFEIKDHFFWYLVER